MQISLADREIRRSFHRHTTKGQAPDSSGACCVFSKTLIY